MLNPDLPHDLFSGTNDLYSILRETRSCVNVLEARIVVLEKNMLEWKMAGNEACSCKTEVNVANTKGNAGMIPNVVVTGVIVGKKR